MKQCCIIKGYRAPEQLIAASKTAEDVERSFYCAYCEWREIPQADLSTVNSVSMS